MTEPMEKLFTAESVRGQVAMSLGIDPDDIALHENLSVLGIGSLEVMRFVTGWRRAGRKVNLDIVMAEPTVAAWVRLLSGAGSRETD